MSITMTDFSQGIVPANIQTLVTQAGAIAAAASGTAAQTINLAGDVVGSAALTQPVVTTIQPGAVTYAKMQNVSAMRLLGNPTGSTSAPLEIQLGGGLSFSGSLLVALLPNYLGAFTTSFNSTALLNVATGVCADSTNTTMITLGAAITKSTGAPWSAGTGAGGMGQALTITASTWYHVFAIVVGGVTDVYFDTSFTAASAPVGTTAFRRIGSFKTDGSSHILQFTQIRNYFFWKAPAGDISTTSPTSGTNVTLTVAPGAPVLPLLNWNFIATGTGAGYSATIGIGQFGSVSSYQQTVAVANTGASGSGGQAGSMIGPATDSSGRVAYNWVINGGSASSASLGISTVGWIDPLGQ